MKGSNTPTIIPTPAGLPTFCDWEYCRRATFYPKEERAVRDLLRKRGQMVRQRTANLLSIQNLITRNTGSSIRSNRNQDARCRAGGRPATQLRLGPGSQS